MLVNVKQLCYAVDTMAKSYLSREAAAKNLRMFFANTNGDEVSVDEVFIAAGRNPDEVGKNKSWFSNKLTSMAEYGLFTRHYSSRRGQKKLVKLKLTNEGKRALGRNLSDSIFIPAQPAQQASLLPSVTIDKEVTVSSVRRDVEALRQKEPELDIWFSVTLKEEPATR